MRDLHRKSNRAILLPYLANRNTAWHVIERNAGRCLPSGEYLSLDSGVSPVSWESLSGIIINESRLR